MQLLEALWGLCFWQKMASCVCIYGKDNERCATERNVITTLNEWHLRRKRKLNETEWNQLFDTYYVFTYLSIRGPELAVGTRRLESSVQEGRV